MLVAHVQIILSHMNTGTNSTEKIFLQSLEGQPEASNSNSDSSMDYSQFFTLIYPLHVRF